MDQDTILTRRQLMDVREGSEQAFRTLYDALHQRIFTFSLRFTHSPDDAKEVVQNVFLRLWKYRSRIDPEQPIEPYLYQIAKNENLKFLRRTARHVALHERVTTPLTSRAVAEDELILAEYTLVAERALATLPPKRKVVFQMAFQEGRSNREIATEMGINVQTVRTQLNRAVRSIKKYLKHHAGISISVVLWLIVEIW